MTSDSSFVPRPTLTSGAVSIGLGAIAVGLPAGTAVQRLLLAAAVVGVAGFALGGRRWQRNGDGIGVVVSLCGCLLLLVTVRYAMVQPSRISHRLEVVPGIVGLWILGSALLPLRFRWSRVLVDVGAGALFVSVLTSGILLGASTATLVVAAAATILAWDAAENAVSLGGQVGADAAADSRRAELVHVGVSTGVAGSIVVVVLGVASIGADGLPLAALVALLVASVVLTLAYHR